MELKETKNLPQPVKEETIKLESKIRSKEERTLAIPLSKKQLAIIADNRQQIDHFNNLILLCQQKEQDLITFILEYENLTMENIEGVSLGEGKIMIVKKQ